MNNLQRAGIIPAGFPVEMTPRTFTRPIPSLQRFSLAAGVSVTLLAGLVLLARTLDTTMPTSVFPGLVTMKADTALAFVLSGLALWFLVRRRHRIAGLCTVIVILMSLPTFADYLFGWDLHIGSFGDPREGQSQPGRMALVTAVMFLLLGIELLMLGLARAGRLIQLVALATGLVPLLAMAGYLSRIPALDAIGPYALAQPATALNFIILSLGILGARPGRGLLATVTRNAHSPAHTGSGQRPAEREVQLNLERIRALREIDGAVTSTTELSAILDLLLEKIELVLLPLATAATVWLFNRESGQFESLASRNPNEKEWEAQEQSALGGRAKKILETKAPLTVRNVQREPQTRPDIYRKQGLVSYLGVPLVAKGEAIGVLGLYTKDEHKFTEEEIELVGALADKAALAIYNSQLYENIDLSRTAEPTNIHPEKSPKLLSELYAALAPLNLSESTREVIDGILERLMDATGADAALIRVWKKETGAYLHAGHRGFSDDNVRGVENVLLRGAVDWVVKHGEPIIAPDIASEPRFEVKVQVKLGFHSCATLPLKIHNDVRGIIHLSSHKLGYFDEEQKDLLGAIAQQMSIAMENRELFDDLKASRNELESASKIKNEFLSVMSHELRTPLSVVMGYAGMIKEKLLGEINPKQEEALEKLLGRANDQLCMINAIMQATQIETREVVVQRQLVNLSDLLTQLKSEYESTHDKERVALIWEYPSQPLPVVSDSAKLRQILVNLISNATKFTNHGSVTVSMRLTEKQGKNWVELKVADTGIGIPSDQIPRIFDRFFQVDSSETRLYGGLGLGLYIVKKFTELFGGRVEVESEPGKGSTFTVTIPHAT